jgi:hypothetical protein
MADGSPGPDGARAHYETESLNGNETERFNVGKERPKGKAHGPSRASRSGTCNSGRVHQHLDGRIKRTWYALFRVHQHLDGPFGMPYGG